MGVFDRIVVVNLDRRPDRLAVFAARATGLRSLDGWVRHRAVDGNVVGVPGYFRSGGGAWGCARSHTEVLQAALMDGVDSLLVLEDDCRFVPDFDTRLAAFLAAVPDDWGGLMVGGQSRQPPRPTTSPLVFRAKDTQRTHAYAVRGRKALRDLYALWVRADRHIDHLIDRWQAAVPVYQPDTFLCGQDAGLSDISGRGDGTRFWSAASRPDESVYLLDVPRAVADDLWHLGATWGDRCPRTGTNKELAALAAAHWPAGRLAGWADGLVAVTAFGDEVPCLWQPGADWEKILDGVGRPAVRVTADATDVAAAQVSALYPRWRAGRVTWVRRSGDDLEALGRMGWVTGRPALRTRLAQLAGEGCYTGVPDLVRQVAQEARRTRGGRVLLAHERLDPDRVSQAVAGPVCELAGSVADAMDALAAVGRA